METRTVSLIVNASIFMESLLAIPKGTGTSISERIKILLGAWWSPIEKLTKYHIGADFDVQKLNVGVVTPPYSLIPLADEALKLNGELISYLRNRTVICEKLAPMPDDERQRFFNKKISHSSWEAYFVSFPIGLRFTFLVEFDPARYSSWEVKKVLGKNIKGTSFVATPSKMSSASSSKLMVASTNGDLNTVEMLLKAGADPNIRDDLGRTPIHMASYNGNAEIVRLLLAAKADPHTIQNNNWSVLYCASCRGHAEIVRLLLTSGVEPNQLTAYGETILDEANKYDFVEVVRALREGGANPKVSDEARRELSVREAEKYASYSSKDSLLWEKAQKPLDKKSEGFANRLCELTLIAEKYVQRDEGKYEKAREEIKEIGKYLNASGGYDRMKLVAFRVAALGTRISQFEFFWNYIGEWQS